MSRRGASLKCNVPCKTLEDRVENGSHPGVKTALTKTEEDGLVSYLIYMAQRGFPLTRTMVKAFAWAIAKRSGNDHRFNPELSPSDQRHPKLTNRLP